MPRLHHARPSDGNRDWIETSDLWTTERVACSCAHRVVPVSESLRLRAIQLRLVPSEKARVAGNSSRGVDTERFTPKLRNTVLVAQLREQLGLGGKETVIGFVGRFVRTKAFTNW